MNTTAPPLPKAAYAGALLGACGWVLGLAGLCLAHARFDLLLSLALPALVASLALGLLLVVAHRCAVCAFRSTSRTSRLVLVGGLLTLIGILLLLADAWIMPALANDPSLRASLRATGSVLSVPVIVPVLAMASGATLLLGALWGGGVEPPRA